MTTTSLGPSFRPSRSAVERHLGLDLGTVRPTRTGARLTMLFGFFAYLPYPAIPLGNNTGIQVGNLLTLVMMLPALALPWRRKPFIFLPVLIVPLLISGIKVCVGYGDPIVGGKLSGLWILSMLPLVAAQLYAPLYPMQLMKGIAACALLHVAIGIWQVKAFSSGYLPLEGLYINPSFASVQAAAKSIVNYVQRPFGLFPEPSAMSSSLGPWVVFWAALAMGLINIREPVSPRWRKIFAFTAAASLWLILVSRSGNLAFVVAALGVLFCMWLIRARANFKSYALFVIALGVVLPALLWFTTSSMQERASTAHGENDSWKDRSSSLVIGFRLAFLTNGSTLLFGMGVGQSNLALWDTARLEAVWSVLLTYVYEQGMVGVIAVGYIGLQLIEVWRRTRFKVVYACVMLVWLIGITVITSYEQLIPTWVMLGFLSVWRDTCDDGRVETSQSGRLLRSGGPRADLLPGPRDRGEGAYAS